MKLILVVLAICGLAAARYNVPVPVSDEHASVNDIQKSQRNWMDPIMLLLFELLRGVLINGSPSLGIPVMDPLRIEKLDISVPAGIVNLNLDLEDLEVRDLSLFRIHTGSLDLFDEFSFDFDVSFPTLDISAGKYDLLGDLFTAIPLFGKGKARFQIEGLRLRGKLYLGQSADEKSVIIERLTNVGFQIGSFRSELTGVIGGGDIDKVVNAVISEVVIDYVNRFQGFLSSVIGDSLPPAVNPILERFDSWEFIDNLIIN